MRAAQRRAMVETDVTGAGKSDLAGHALHQFVQVEILPGAVAVANHRDRQHLPGLAFAPLRKALAGIAHFHHRRRDGLSVIYCQHALFPSVWNGPFASRLAPTLDRRHTPIPCRSCRETRLRS
jgi:hypothetical protein